MAYCAVVDVIRELPTITIDASSKPSEAEVTQFCADVSADMDARLRAAGLAVPIADPQILQIVLPIAVNGVKARVVRASEHGSVEIATMYENLYQREMARVEQSPSVLRLTDSPGEPQGTSREDEAVRFRVGEEDW